MYVSLNDIANLRRNHATILERHGGRRFDDIDWRAERFALEEVEEMADRRNYRRGQERIRGQQFPPTLLDKAALDLKLAEDRYFEALVEEYGFELLDFIPR